MAAEGEDEEPPAPAPSLVSIRTGPATEEEKKLLRSAQLVRKATPEEVEAWLAVSTVHMSEKSKTAFHGMSPENQYRVMYEGPLTESKDSTEILYARVQRFMDMENQLKKLANVTEEAQKAQANKPKEKKVSELAMAIGKALVSTDLPEEVPDSERRFAAPVGSAQPAAPQAKAATTPSAGSRKGVGGVIEALQKKYNMAKGERAKVIAETKELWKLEGERTVPKTQCNQGWRWVLSVPDDAAKKKSEAQKAKASSEAAAKAPEVAKAAAEVRERSRSREKKKDRSRASSEEKKRSRGEAAARRGEEKPSRKERDRRDERKGHRRRRSPSSQSSEPPRRRSPSTSPSRHKRRRR